MQRSRLARPKRAAVRTVALAGLAMLAAGCAVSIHSPGYEYRVALLDKIEGKDAQIEHNKVAGIAVGSVYLGIIERSIFRVPGAADATVETTNFLNAQGQSMKTVTQTRVGQYESAK